MPDLRGTTLGRFTLIDLLGRGGMGEVYRARDESLLRDVAVKVLPPELTSHPGRIERFVQEARAASALNHPHLTAVYEIGSDPIHYIAMEFVRGRSLRAVFDAGRPDLKRFLDWMLQVSDALGAAHEAGVVHRDIKPENVMIADDGYAKVLDFGIAKLRADEMPGDETATRASLTNGGMAVGTSGYMSPEQARGLATDRRTDIFALGCVLYEGLAGGAAFDAPSIVERLHRVIHDEPAPIQSRTAGLPVELVSLVRKCLAKDPEDRYQSMKDVAIDLRYVRRQLETGTAAIAPPAPASRRLRPAWAAPVVAAVVVAIGIGAVVLYRRAPESAPAAIPSSQPVTIERLTTSEKTISAAISLDGRSIARVEAIGNQQSLWMHDVASGQEREIVPAGSYAFYGEQFSPDGKFVAFTERGPAGYSSGRLKLIPIEGGTPRVLLTGILMPVTYAPDGKRLAFLRESYPDQDSSALIVANSDGSGERVLATRHSPDVFTPAFFTAASWSPDGKRIAASSRNVSTEAAQLVEVDVESGNERELSRSKDDITATLWLPDGSGLLFVSRPFVMNLGSPGQIWLKPYPEGPPRRITTDLIDYRSLSIDNDGRTLISVGGDYRVSIYNVPLDGSPLRRIRSDRYDGIQGIVPLAGGGLIATTVVRGEAQILRLSEDGATRTVLTSEGTNTFPAVSPDGSTIAMVSTRDGASGVWRMNVDGSGQRLLAHVPGARWLSIAADPLRVICTSYKGATSSTWAVPMDGGQAVEIARDMDRAVVSPDGKWLGGVYAPRQDTAISGPVAAVLPLDRSGPIRPLARLVTASDMGLLLWARDGSGLIATTSARFNLNFYGIDGSAARELTNLADEVLVAGALSVDGKSVVAARGVLSRDVFAIKGVTAR